MRRTLVALFVLCMLFAPILQAEDQTLEVGQGDTIASILQKRLDQRVTITLSSGTEITGMVRTVGDEVVVLSELSGKEFYDAVVDLDAIAAVMIRVRGTTR